MRFDEIRHHVMQMESQDCRQELARTLERLDMLESHFEWLAEVVYELCQHAQEPGFTIPLEIESILKVRGLPSAPSG